MRRAQKRLYFIVMVLACLGIAAGLTLYALRDNISYFFTPHEMHDQRALNDARVRGGSVFRLGGLVKQGTLEKDEGDTLARFVVTDNIRDVTVEYKGILPDLFREGQGVVAKGSLGEDGVFVASELLAKHDEAYTPPELKKKMKEAHDKGQKQDGAKEEAAP